MTIDEAIKHAEEVASKECEDWIYCIKCREEHKQLAGWLKKLKQLREQTKWIPVSEGLPEEETDVLICNRNGDIALSRGSYSTEVENDFIWYTSGWRFGKVIAWMPLPEPYKEVEK